MIHCVFYSKDQPMRTLEAHLSNYAAYHRDRRNIATHFLGIPMIVVGVFVLLARFSVVIEGVSISPAWLLFAGSVMFYASLDTWFGLAMTVVNAPALYAGARLASLSAGLWLTAGVGLFLVGWVVQFIGHAFEGRKPAFVDDLVGLLVGPLFLVAETAFALGLRRHLHGVIEKAAGPTRARKPSDATPAPVGAQPG
jgi:uncharacterized membrane protein YGL010W